jgi:hypothetical protein
MRSSLRILPLFLPAVVPATGCHHTHSPTVDIWGSYFPAWIISIVAGLFSTIVVRQVLVGLRLAPHLHPAPLIYLCFQIGFTLLTWLIFFQN